MGAAVPMLLTEALRKRGKDGGLEGLPGLKNDIYVRKWTTVNKRKGKKPIEVQHELHVNPVAIGLGFAGMAVAGAAALAAMWLGQTRIEPTTRTVKYDYRARVTYIGGERTDNSPFVVYRGSLPVFTSTWGRIVPFSTADYFPRGDGWRTFEGSFSAEVDEKGVTYYWTVQNDKKLKLELKTRDGFLG